MVPAVLALFYWLFPQKGIMRAMWTGSLGFGLVNIPIRLYSAVQNSTLDLDMLDKKDHANIRFKRVNEHTGKEVPWERIVKGYLVDDRYVVLTPDDLAKAAPEKTKHIDIMQFVEETEINSIYFETPYYAEPDKAGVRAYALLREAMLKTGLAGIGLFVMHNREHIVVIKAEEDVIIVHKIRFQQEIRSPAELNLPTAKSKPAELKMAVNLIHQLSAPFDISTLKDEYTGNLKKLIKAKAKGKRIAYEPVKAIHSPVKDIMTQLKASLAEKKKKVS